MCAEMRINPQKLKILVIVSGKEYTSRMCGGEICKQKCVVQLICTVLVLRKLNEA